MCLRERDFAKADAIASAQLRGDGKIDRDHVRDFRITANGLAISKQNNRFASGRHLNRSWCNRFGDKIDIMISLQLYTFEPHAHPVRIWRDDEYFIRESLNR